MLILRDITFLITTQRKTEVTITTQFISKPQNLTVNSPLFKVALFGQDPIIQFTKANKIKKSTLNVKLLGILLSDKQKSSQVILQIGKGKARVYSIEDKLPEGAIIKNISQYNVLILNQGNLETISLPNLATPLDD